MIINGNALIIFIRSLNRIILGIRAKTIKRDRTGDNQAYCHDKHKKILSHLALSSDSVIADSSLTSCIFYTIMSHTMSIHNQIPYPFSSVLTIIILHAPAHSTLPSIAVN